MRQGLNTPNSKAYARFRNAVFDLRKKIDNDLIEFYGESMLRATAAVHPPGNLQDGAFIHFRGYLAWSEIDGSEKTMILDDWIMQIVQEFGFKGYWIPHPSFGWLHNEVLRVYSDQESENDET